MDPQKSIGGEENNETFDQETLEQLRDDLNALAYQEKQSFEVLQNDFRGYLDQFSEENGLSAAMGESVRLNLEEFLRNLSVNVQQKSKNIGCLTQVGLKMIDYLTEQSYQQSLLSQKYETVIENLQYQNGCLSSRNINIENDVEYFRQRLQATENQLENIVTQESEEKAQNGEKQEGISYDYQSARDRQIEQLQKELEKIREEIQHYKQSHHNREQKDEESSKSKYMRIRSEYNILPQSQISSLNLHLFQCKKRIQILQSENIRLQRELDISQTKVRSRRNSKTVADIKQSRLIELIPEQLGDQTERKNEEVNEEVIHASPSAFSILHKANLLGDIKESLESSNSYLDASNRIICISSNRSLFANLQLHDLVRDSSANLRNNNSIKCFKRLGLDSVVFEEKIDLTKQKSLKVNLGIDAQRIALKDKSTMTSGQVSAQKLSFWKRMIIKPVVDILMRMIWRKGSAVGCIG